MDRNIPNCLDATHYSGCQCNRVKPCGCGATCDWAWAAEDTEPCWGSVSAVDELECGDGDYQWVHACSGHEAQAVGLGGYEKEP